MSSKIVLNDVLKMDDILNVKIRFNLMFDGNWNPIEIFKNNNQATLLEGHYWNYEKKKSYKEGQITIGFIRINPKEDRYLLFHVGKITKDLNKFNAVGYEYQTLTEYEKYFGRLVISYKNKVQAMIRKASSVIDECEVVQILPSIFDNDIFPGYDKVCIGWNELSRVIEKDSWKTALQNQKGVYLITDKKTGKMYVGSAYGNEMLLGRWKAYLKTGHGGNIELKKIPFENIKENFTYSILDIFKSTVDDKVILERETYWKNVLNTRIFGYNKN